MSVRVAEWWLRVSSTAFLLRVRGRDGGRDQKPAHVRDRTGALTLNKRFRCIKAPFSRPCSTNKLAIAASGSPVTHTVPAARRWQLHPHSWRWCALSCTNPHLAAAPVEVCSCVSHAIRESESTMKPWFCYTNYTCPRYTAPWGVDCCYT